ncbi:transporter [Adhaeretor mobilis]|uniref:Transporter n=1 Tax=Adhaeretor mobilis TaxID=1930276 RepID=A0A517MWB4_9BACT|nr:transporter [Adhaeretor mobilis]QDS99163.1 hypothetical protein HG15A2_24550 [Adhaeretor mobilis]
MRNRNGISQHFIFLGLVFLCSATSHGQWFEFSDDFSKCDRCQRNPWDERIETERHDFTQSAVTVGRGIFQIESGYSYFYNDAEGEIEDSHTGPEMLLRYGISEDIEVRLRWNYVWQFIDVSPDESGSEDLRYSIKLQMTRQLEESLLPTSALEVRGTAPTGGEAYSTGGVEFGLDYIYQWELTEGVTFAGSTGYAQNGNGDFGLIPDLPTQENFNVLSQSAVLGMELSATNSMYIEWYGLYSDGLEDEIVVSIFNIGIDHYVTDDFVIDFRAGVGLSGDSDDFFTGVGGGYRF